RDSSTGHLSRIESGTGADGASLAENPTKPVCRPRIGPHDIRVVAGRHPVGKPGGSGRVPGGRMASPGVRPRPGDDTFAPDRSRPAPTGAGGGAVWQPGVGHRFSAPQEEPAMVKPYTAVGLIPTVRGI